MRKSYQRVIKMAKRGRKLSENKTIRVKWKDYVKIREKAMDEDSTITEVAHELLGGYTEKSGAENTGKSKENTGSEYTPDSQEKFTCSECGKEFDTKKQLQGHKLGAHQEESPEEQQKFKCENCGREFDTKQGLSLHKNYCGKSASQKPGSKK